MDAVDPNLETIVEFVGQHREGARLPDIVGHVNQPPRTVQRWLADLVEADRLKVKGKGRAKRYVVPKPRAQPAGEPATAVPAGTGEAATARMSFPPTATGLPPVTMASNPAPTPGQSPAKVTSNPMPAERSPVGAMPPALPQTVRQPASGRPPAAAPLRRQPAAGAPAIGGESVDASADDHAPPADAPFARYPEFEELYYHIFPRIVRAGMPRDAAETIVREQADYDYQTDPRRKQAFIAAAMAKLDALTLEDVHPYGVGPMLYGDWRKAWNTPRGVRHW